LRFLFFGEEEEDSSRRRHAVDYTEGGGGTWAVPVGFAGNQWRFIQLHSASILVSSILGYNPFLCNIRLRN